MNFILEFIAIDRTAAPSGACRITRLQHEIGNDPMEDDISVIVSSDQCFEIFARL